MRRRTSSSSSPPTLLGRCACVACLPLPVLPLPLIPALLLSTVERAAGTMGEERNTTCRRPLSNTTKMRTRGSCNGKDTICRTARGSRARTCDTSSSTGRRSRNGRRRSKKRRRAMKTAATEVKGTQQASLQERTAKSARPRLRPMRSATGSARSLPQRATRTASHRLWRG